MTFTDIPTGAKVTLTPSDNWAAWKANEEVVSDWTVQEDSGQASFTMGEEDVTIQVQFQEKTVPEETNTQFFIRKDNSIIPQENGKTQYPNPGYTGHGWFYGTVTGTANIDNPTLETKLYTVQELQELFGSVQQVIKKAPTAEEIAKTLSDKKAQVSFDPSSQVILWYVAKVPKNDPQCPYHVDGVILNKDAQYATLQYFANTGDEKLDTALTTALPYGGEIQLCKVGDVMEIINGSDNFNREGYTFEGWATSATGTVAYKAGHKITIKEPTQLYAVWKPIEEVKHDPAVTILTYYDGALKHHSPVETKEIGTNFNFDSIKDEVEYNRAQYKLAYVGYMIGENAEAVDKNNTELTPGSEAITLERGNTYQIHVYYERIPQGNLTVVHQMTYKDKAGHVVGEPIVLKQDSSLQKVGSEFKAADLILADYANYYVSADPETVTITEGLNQMTLKYEKTVDVSVESPLLIHHYQTIVNGVIAEEKVVEETIQSVQGQPFKTGDSIFIKDHAREKDGYKMTSTSCDGTEGFLTLGLESTANKADIYYQKEVAEWTVKYIDEAEVSIAEDLTGRIAPDAEITEDLVLDGTPIKKNITEYTYKTMRIDADDHVIYMIYKVKETTGPVNPGEDVTPGGDGGNTPGGDGGSTSGGGDNDGGSGNTETVIPDNNTPLAPNVPTTPDNTVVVPAEVVIDENEVPLSESPKENSDNPKTGTAQAKDLSALALLLAAGALGIEFKRKKA